MSNEQRNNQDNARRAAEIVSLAMNVSALLGNETHLQAMDAGELRSAFQKLATELDWFVQMVSTGTLQGLSLPPDASSRLSRFQALIGTWNAVGSPSREFAAAAKECIGLVQSA
jgi:hypothetical protein